MVGFHLRLVCVRSHYLSFVVFKALWVMLLYTSVEFPVISGLGRGFVSIVCFLLKAVTTKDRQNTSKLFVMAMILRPFEFSVNLNY